MQQFRKISAYAIALTLIGGFVATNVLAGLVQATDWIPAKVLLFLCLALLPGIVLLRLLRIVPRTLIVGSLYGLGLSLLVLMLSGLLANQLWPFLGVARPLDAGGALVAWDILVAVLIGLSLGNRQPILLPAQPARPWRWPAWALLGLSALLPAGATFGAFLLNNHGGSWISELTLVLGAALIVLVVFMRRHIPDGLLAWFIFLLGLSLLLMTSMRSWDIIGHDIERELRVYSLTELHGLWNIGLYRDPYNACLSITILPEVLANLLGVSGVTVFKLIMQIIFAACGVLVFALLRRYVSKAGALTGSLLFLCYPTFINDAAMLTRQGVAYLFFALALLVVSNKSQKVSCKLLFLLCAAGAILSHYSTAYMLVGLFAAAVMIKLVIGLVWGRRNPDLRYRNQRSVLSPLFALLIFVMTFGWYAQITATSTGLFATLGTSLAKIPTLFSDDNKSSDTSAALLFAGKHSQVDLYEAYLKNGGQLDLTKLAEAEPYLPVLASDDLPLTKLGERAREAGINPSTIAIWRQHFAKVLQLLAMLGVVYVTYRLFRHRAHDLGFDFICLSLAGIFMLTVMVVLPVLSVNYGLLRAFQQSLLFLALPIVLFLIWLGKWLGPRLRTILVAAGMALLFLLFTGVFAQFLGGSSPTITLNNKGLYYGLYYTSAVDRRSFEWLKTHLSKDADVRAANFNRALMHDPQYPFRTPGIMPTQLKPQSYVYLDQSQVLSGRFYVYYQSSPIIMTLSPDYYDIARDRLYSTGSTRVYR